METVLGVTKRQRFEDLYALHGSEALRLAYALTGSRPEAEDLAQEAFARLLGRFGDLRRPDAFRAYLMRTIVNLSKTHYRRRVLERERQTPGKPAPSDTTRTVDDRHLLVEALRRLPQRQQTAVVLRYCVDLSEHDTAEILGTSVKAVKSLVARGLATLREQEEVVNERR